MGSNPILDNWIFQNFSVYINISKMFNINNRPISPHLSIYSPQLSSLFSIWHRITGVVLATVVSICLLILKIFTISNFFYLIMLQRMFLILNSTFWLIDYFYILILLFLSYHILNGIRHIIWDIGIFLNIKFLFNSSITFFIFLSLIIGVNIIKFFQ